MPVPPFSSAGPAYLTKAEVERFFATIPKAETRNRLLFDIIYRHGLRRREATLLRREHVTDDRIWIGRVKHGISGEYPIHPTTRRLLQKYLPTRTSPDSPFLFTSRQSGAHPIAPTTIWTLFRRYARQAGLPENRLHPHVLRHSLATHLLNAHWDLADVMDWLGHAEISSTTIYAQVTNKRRLEQFQAVLDSPELADTDR